MRKRVIATLMAGALTMGLLAGCGKDANQSTTAAGTTAAGKETTAAGTTAGTAAETTAEAKKEEAVTVKWCMFTAQKAQDHDLVIEDLNKKLEEKINVRLELEMIPQGEFDDKMKLASTAGEDYDLVFTSNWRNKFDDNMSRDAFLPLNDLIDQYGQDLKAEIPDWLMDVARVNGEIYAVPNMQVIAKQYGVAIQKEYADKYNFHPESMKSIHELEPFLDEIVKNEPQLFPVDYRNSVLLSQKYEGLAGDYIYIDKNDPDAKLIPATEVTQDEDRMNREWYEKGYIRKDIATVTDNTADVKANRYACTVGVYKPGWDAEFTASHGGTEYITIPFEGIYVGVTSGIETMTAINVNSKHPAEAMKLLNTIYTDKEIFNELLFGLEGVHYNKTAENHVEPVENTKYYYGTEAWKFGNQFNAWYLPGQADGLWEATDKMNREAQVSVLRGFVFNPENVQAELAQLAAVTKEFKNMQYVADDIEKYIQDKNQKLEQAGIMTVLEEVQKQVDAWKAAK